MIVKCPKCGTKYRLDPAKFTSKNPKIRCKNCGEVFLVFENVIDWEGANPPYEEKTTPAPSVSGKIIIASANSELSDVITKITGRGDLVKTIKDGVEALYKILTEKPSIAIIDIDLPRLYGFEVSELTRRNDPQKTIKIILIGSIYNKEAYKRKAEYLYGADYYLDKHTIGEELPKIIGTAVVEKKPEEKKEAPLPPPPTKVPKKEIDISTLTPEDQELLKKAERKARIIATDIALYNEEAIKEGLIHGDVYERIAKDLKAGRDHYEKTIPDHIRKLKDFLGEAIEKMLSDKRKQLGL